MFSVDYIYREDETIPKYCFGVTNAGVYFFLENKDMDEDFGIFLPSPTRKLTFDQLIKIFPESLDYFKEKLKEESTKFDKLKFLNKEAIKKFDVVVANKWYDEKIKESKKRISQLEETIKKFSTVIFPKNKNSAIIDKNLIERVKQVPISNFIEFKGRVAKSIWNPTERTPSMHYYEKDNKVHCFSTNTHGDVISVIEKIYNLKFIDAVKFLSKYI